MNEKAFFKEIMTYRLFADKSLGQNFLIDPSLASRIVDLLKIEDGDHVLEIGAGLGSLSYFLGKYPAKSRLIDIDERLIAFLDQHFADQDQMSIWRENVLKCDLSPYEKIIGNLPYYLTSRIIEHVLLHAIKAERIVLMCQKEAARKLFGPRRVISPLSLLLEHVASAKEAFLVGRAYFLPSPHVDSLVFILTPNEHLKDPFNHSLYQTMNRLFLHRRKTIQNNLTALVGAKETAQKILQECHIAPGQRPEELTIGDYLLLDHALRSRGLVNTI